MSWLWLKAVPWGTIISNAPTIVEGARKLLDRRAAGTDMVDKTASDPASLAQRLRIVELRQQEMLDVIDKLASSNEQLTEAVTYLRARAVFNFRISVVLAVVVAVLVIHGAVN
jgi:t-SNARE complex subunit (syntaxin)